MSDIGYRPHTAGAKEVSRILRELERAVCKLPTDGKEQRWAVQEFNRMLGDMFPMLTWWREG